MSRLALYLLGPPRVYRNGAAVGFDRRKVLALLAYLAVSSHRHSRDEMSELLWSGENRDRARANLRQTLSLLGSAIGEDRLSADRMSVGLAVGRGLWMDVTECRRRMEKGRSADGQGDLSAAQSSLTQAMKLIRGEFLSGFYLKDSRPFEEWQQQTQETLRGEQAMALERLVEIHGARGEHDRAVSCALQWLDLDPLEESVHRQLMRLYALAGQRLEALRQYEKCRSLLERELEEKPDQRTERLREQITSGALMSAAEQEEGRSQWRATQGKQPRRGELAWGKAPFLFTRTEHEEGPAPADLEARLRDAIGTARGRILRAAGQTICAVFPTALYATRAALLAQDCGAGQGVHMALIAEEQPRREEDPSPGLAERAGLLLEVSHPGQILVSEAAAALITGQGALLGAALRALGSHRLRDLGPARSLYQLDRQGSPQSFPPLDTLDSRPNNLQVQPTRFIGRARELETVQQALRSEDTRLVTLVGAAGTGKTRLALQAAAGQAGRFQQGVFFVDLAVLREPTQVAGAIGAALDFREAGGDGRSLMETLKDYLARRQMLLILDNFEHLLPAARDAATLLGGCPRLVILATSREALRLRAERVIPVPPMQLAESGQAEDIIARSDAVRLFVDRAEAVQPDFVLNRENMKTIAALCGWLDGIPLAIELAAAHIGTLAPRALLAALGSRLSFLKGGPRDLPARQQTLRGEIDWSHHLLANQERLLFGRVSVFPGGCTPQAAGAVCKAAAGEDLDVPAALASLANKCLLRAAPDGDSRYLMLETIREYARERLAESGEAAHVESRFSSYFLDLAEEAEPGMFTRQQKSSFDRIEKEYGNLRAGLGLMHDRGARTEGLRLAGAMGWFWFRRARFSEGQYWLELFRGLAAADDPPGPRAKVAYWLGWMKLCVGSAFWGNPEGKRYFAESLELFRRAGDKRGAALSLVWLGWKEGDIEDDDGRATADESVALARQTGDPWALSWCLKIANSYLRRPDKDLDARAAALEEAIALARKSGDPFLLSQALSGMGNVYAWIGELARSLPWYLDSLRVSQEIDDKWSILDTMNCLGDSHLGLGHLTEAKGIFSQGLRIAQDLGTRGYLVFFMQGLCGVAKSEGRMKRAARLWSAEASILEPGMRYDSGFPTRFGLDEGAARAEWTAGQSMTLEQTVAYALSEE